MQSCTLAVALDLRHAREQVELTKRVIKRLVALHSHGSIGRVRMAAPDIDTTVPEDLSQAATGDNLVAATFAHI
jgi:hypothetical protein